MITKPNTKELLAESLKELAKSKSVNKITIRELTKNCGLTSPTFYNHFRDKYELMAWIYNRKIAASIKYLGDNATFEDLLCCWLNMALEDEEFFLNLLKNAGGQNSFQYATNDYAIKLLEDWIRARHNLRELPEEIQFHMKFFLRAVSESVKDWCLGKKTRSARELAKLFVAAMPEPLKPLLLQN